eukprot:scaffold7155_cov63-Phaeocystis_antarctica.AAC.2
MSCGSGLLAAMHSSAVARSAGLSEHSCAASSASTLIRRLSRSEGMLLAARRKVGRQVLVCGAGLSEPSRAARFASTSCGSWRSLAASRRQGMMRSEEMVSGWLDAKLAGTGIVTIIFLPGAAPEGTTSENCPAAVLKVRWSPTLAPSGTAISTVPGGAGCCGLGSGGMGGKGGSPIGGCSAIPPLPSRRVVGRQVRRGSALRNLPRGITQPTKCVFVVAVSKQYSVGQRLKQLSQPARQTDRQSRLSTKRKTGNRGARQLCDPAAPQRGRSSSTAGWSGMGREASAGPPIPLATRLPFARRERSRSGRAVQGKGR